MRPLRGKHKMRCVYHPNTIASLSQNSLRWNKHRMYEIHWVAHNIPNLLWVVYLTQAPQQSQTYTNTELYIKLQPASSAVVCHFRSPLVVFQEYFMWMQSCLAANEKVGCGTVPPRHQHSKLIKVIAYSIQFAAKPICNILRILK